MFEGVYVSSCMTQLTKLTYFHEKLFKALTQAQQWEAKALRLLLLFQKSWADNKFRMSFFLHENSCVCGGSVVKSESELCF